jgi:hypothetical protein
MSRALSILLVVAALIVAGGSALGAQGTTDVITGTITDARGAPVAGAQVVAEALATGARRTARSNRQGRFTLVFPDRHGQYRVTVTAAGLNPVAGVLRRVGGEEVLIADVRLTPAAVMMEGIEVIAPALEAEDSVELFQHAEMERRVTRETLEMLPIDPDDLNSVSSLMPGVLIVGDSTGGSGFSVFGQDPSANQVTLDGATFGGGATGGRGIPAEAVRVTQVISNTFDVSRGQFSGGQIATSTRSGTNTPQGSLTVNVRDPALTIGGANTAFSGAGRQLRASGGYGGPIIRNKLFYFVSGSWQRRSQGIASLLTADEVSLLRLGVSRDSVSRLLSLVSANAIYGPEVRAPSWQVNDNLTMLSRVDYTLNDSHTLTLRLDANWTGQDGSSGQLGLPQSGSSTAGSGGGVMGTLTSKFGNGWINELRVYGAQSTRETLPYQISPSGRVRVTSEFQDGSRAVSNLSFGGGGQANQSTSYNFEIGNELALLLGSTHRVAAGLTLTSVRSEQESGSNRFGTFVFESLQDFAANQPSQYSRNLIAQERVSGGWNAAFFLGDTWRPRRELQLVYGTRVETSRVARLPEYNRAVDEAFGRQTDRIPNELAFTPRVGFNYTLPRRGNQAGGTLRGGVGVFRSAPAWGLFSSARDLTGLPGAQSQIICVGAGVPAPAWELYREDPSSIPTECTGEPSQTRSSGRGPSVAVFDPGYRTAQTWRASAGVQRRLSVAISGNVDVTYALGRNQQGVTDLNLRETPAFTLPAEAERPMYVPAEAIVQRNGQVSYIRSRVNPAFGSVMEVNSDLSSRTTQVSAGLNGNLRKHRINLSGSYSFTRSVDEGSVGGGSGGGGFASVGSGSVGSLRHTGGNPNEASWGTSGNERRHSISGTAARPFGQWLTVTVVGRATSGTPFSPIVGGDVNGDGARNDLAFIFDPLDTRDPELGTSMQRVLNTVPSAVRRCLASQLGQIAERNSCRQPWSYGLDLRFNVRPKLPEVGQRMTLSIEALNSLSALDELINGPANLKGWGQQARVDNVLLYPRGFDYAERAFRYEVNERFGLSSSRTQAFRAPFQLQVQGQMNVGRAAQGRGGSGGGR